MREPPRSCPEMTKSWPKVVQESAWLMTRRVYVAIKWMIFTVLLRYGFIMVIYFVSFSIILGHPPKRRRVTYASGIRPASASASVSASTLCTSLKPLRGIISYCTSMVYLLIVKMGGGGSMHPLKNYGGFCLIPLNAFNYIAIWQPVL